MAPRIRLVAIDLDGTLLDREKRIGERTAAAVRGLAAKGVKAVIASARPPRSVRSFYERLGLDTWQINYNGALVWDEPARRAVLHRPMEGDLVREIVERARALRPEVLMSCEVLDRWYTDRYDPAFVPETGKIFRPDVIAPVDSFCRGPITKLLLLGDPATVSEMVALLAREFTDRAGWVRNDRDLVQIMDRTVSKAAALRFVAEGYGVPLEETMAIGDAENDIEMLREAGVGVAMGNAPEDVKAIAGWVAPSNEEEGVLAALRRYGLCP
jgi:Cof subfamily protein (haloacid dehalogenase superfamily)